MSVREHENLVGVVGEVDVGIPCEVLAAHDVAVECELDSGVTHVTDIVIIAGKTVGYRDGHIVEHVGCETVEVLCRTGETATEEFEIHSGVEVGVGLPCDFLVSDGRTLDGDFSIGVGDGEHVGVKIVTDVVVTL